MHIHFLIPRAPSLASRIYIVLLTLTLSLVNSTTQAEDLPKAGYEPGFSNIVKIAGELHAALEPKKQQLVQPGIILLDSLPTPFVAPIVLEQNGQTQRTVELSAGLIQFINFVAHAKALSEPGNDFVKTYALRASSAPTPPAVAEGLPQDKAWAFDVMNIQAGQFNQMAGALVAMDYAHHYLGHYKKYAAQLAPDANGMIPPINNVVSEKEWREAVLKGAKNALDCGLGVDGMKALFECMDAMPSRPAWCGYLVPNKANLSKLSKDLQRLENDFFLVEK